VIDRRRIVHYETLPEPCRDIPGKSMRIKIKQGIHTSSPCEFGERTIRKLLLEFFTSFPNRFEFVDSKGAEIDISTFGKCCRALVLRLRIRAYRHVNHAIVAEDFD
jgi:hypothetical protein